MRLSAIMLAVVCAACPAPTTTSNAPQPADSTEQTDGDEVRLDEETSAKQAAETVDDRAIDAISETEARAILADTFRRAGFRILYDEPPAASSVALDGYDPLNAVGYEYIDVSEQASSSTVRALASAKILVIGPASRAAVIEASTTFVNALVATQK